jgi:hypothetical protein
MAGLDASFRVLTDPRFMDTLTYTRFTQAVGDDGIAVNSGTTTPFYGHVVSVDSGTFDASSTQHISRFAEGSQILGAITITTRTVLIAGQSGYDGDQVTWQGRNYYVVDVRNFSNYGTGFISADCVLMPLGG